MSRLTSYRRTCALVGSVISISAVGVIVAGSWMAPETRGVENAIYECMFLLLDDSAGDSAQVVDCAPTCSSVPRIVECTRSGASATLAIAGEDTSEYRVSIWGLRDAAHTDFELLQRPREAWVTTAGRWTQGFLEILIFTFPVFVLALLFVLRLDGNQNVRVSEESHTGVFATRIEGVKALGFQETTRFTSSAGSSVMLWNDSLNTEAMISRLKNGKVFVEFIDTYEDGRALLTNNASIPPGTFVLPPDEIVAWFPHLIDSARLLDLHGRLRLNGPVRATPTPLDIIGRSMAASFERQITSGYLRPKGQKLGPTFSGALRYAALIAPPYGWIRSLYLRGAAHCCEHDLLNLPQTRPDRERPIT